MGECNVVASVAPPDDLLAVSVIFAADGGLATTQLTAPDSGIAALWVESPLCLSDAALSPLDACVTHLGWLRVTATSADASVSFDYNLGGGVHPSLAVESALSSMATMAVSVAHDAGFTLR